MPSNRCPVCLINWPRSDEYKKCPKCEEETDPVRNAKSMPDDEAASEKRHYEFERFYENWDETHDPKRLTTDNLSDTLSETSNPG